MNFAGTLIKSALTYAKNAAVSEGNSVVLSYAELADRVPRLAYSLRNSLNLETGDRIGLVMKNCPEVIETIYASWYAGLSVVPINAKLHPREFGYILNDSEAKACFVTSDLMQSVNDAKSDAPKLKYCIEIGTAYYQELYEGNGMPIVDVAPRDLAWLFYTSGTTGRPKGAMLSHRNIYSMTMNYLGDIDAISPDDCIIHAAPMSHGSGLYSLPHIARGANNIIPESGGFDVAETLALIEYWPNCTFFFAPTMITRLINAPNIQNANMSKLKTIVYGGAPMYLNDTLKALEVIGPKMVQLYGQGESPMTITWLPKHIINDRAHPHYHERLSSVGIARTDVEVRIVNGNGKSLETDQIGEIIVRGDVVMEGYWNNPEATVNSIRDGWLWTGDIGKINSEGFLTLKDRSKDLIISGGTNIYPREIEEILLKHPAVIECAVIGRPHADWGEEAVAFICVHPGATVTKEELNKICLDHIARFKRPKDYRFVDALKKNNYGKILKTELRNILKNE